MSDEIRVVKANGPVLVFGDAYSNLQATEAVLAEARSLQVPMERIICTGDLAAYCGDPVATIDLVRASGMHVVMGNCGEQLAASADSCACGFPADSLCERLSSAWFAHAHAVVRDDQRRWLSAMPRRLDLEIAGGRLAVIHGGVSAINRFVFGTTPVGVKREEIGLAGCDGAIGGHCGLPFTEIVDGRLWHNAGVIGMPANDGTPRVWFSLLTPGKVGLAIEHRAIDYDHAAAARSMHNAGLPAEYRVALATGIWPSFDVLPAREREEQGAPLTPGRIIWERIAARAAKAESKLHWPDRLVGAASARK